MRDHPVEGGLRPSGPPRWVMAIGAVAALCAVSTAAFGLPWDVDMADSRNVKAYERDMGTLPEGVVAQRNLASPTHHAPNFVRGSAEGEALGNPLPDDAATRALGQRMFGVYCTPCHGADGASGGPVTSGPGRVPPATPLTGPLGRAKSVSDGWLYLTIRNGSAIMPSYSWAMTDDEMWAVVRHVRTLPGARFQTTPSEGESVPPAPTPEVVP